MRPRPPRRGRARSPHLSSAAKLALHQAEVAFEAGGDDVTLRRRLREEAEGIAIAQGVRRPSAKGPQARRLTNSGRCGSSRSHHCRGPSPSHPRRSGKAAQPANSSASRGVGASQQHCRVHSAPQSPGSTVAVALRCSAPMAMRLIDLRQADHRKLAPAAVDCAATRRRLLPNISSAG